MDNEKLVTVISVTYNIIKAGRKESFLQMLNSVKTQNYPYVQHLIVDGLSNDGSQALFDELGVEYISDSDLGIYDAMNKGVLHARGKYIAFLNSDDFYHDTRAISESMHAIAKDKLDFTTTNMIYVNDNFPESKNIFYSNFINIYKFMPVGHPTIVCKKEILEKYPFDIHYKIAADYDFLFKVLKNGYKGKAIPLTCVTFREGGLSSLKVESKKEVKQIIKKYTPYKKEIGKNILALEYKNLPKISVVTLCSSVNLSDNQNDALQHCKESVKVQSYSYIEHIIFAQEGRDFSQSFQLALKKAKGDYILFLPEYSVLSDNTIIEKIMQKFLEEKIQAIYCDLTITHSNKSIERKTWGKLFSRHELIKNMVPIQAIVYRKDILENANFQKEKLTNYDLHIDLFLKIGYAYAYYNKSLVTVPLSEIGKDIDEEIKEVEKINFSSLVSSKVYEIQSWKKRIKLFNLITIIRTVENMWEKKYYFMGLFHFYTKKK